ncbi:MAG: hypothetical protein HGA65_06525, partial [Oscillochloris sp.]|nr:hypothetical protein [Oscillochloris sp.]
MALLDNDSDLPVLAVYAERIRTSPDLAPFLFYNFTAIPAIVEAFGGETDSLVLEQRAGDPNTSLEALAYLAGCFPVAFCANPIFPLLLFERPSLPSDMEPTSLGRLLAYAGLPGDFVGAVAAYGRPEMATAARLHIALLGEAGSGWYAEIAAALDSLTNIPEDDLLVALVALDLVPTWLHERLARTGRAALLRALGRLAKQDTAPAALVRPRSARAQAAADPNRPLEELVLLIEDEEGEVRAALATNPAFGPADLLRLKRFEDWAENEPSVYEALAANPRAPAEVLREIAQNRIALNTAARREVARNPATPPEVLLLLANEEYAADIRIILAGHPNLGTEQRALMAASSLAAAAGSDHPLYRAIVLAQPSVSTELTALALRSPHWVERLSLALNPAANPAALSQLAQDGNR